MRIKLHNRNIYSIFAILTNQDNENMEEYKYTGPATYLSPSEGGCGMILLVNEDEVKAEVNINVATIKGVYDKYTKEYDKVKEFYVAAKYLEPVKPEPIHFDPKDDVDVPHFFDDLFPGIANIQSKHGKIGGEDFTQELSEETLGNIRETARKRNDGHEVGGNHYKMAIEPWDFIYANHIPFDESCIIKYACRHKQKNGAEDIEKIISYAKHILKTQYGLD